MCIIVFNIGPLCFFYPCLRQFNVGFQDEETFLPNSCQNAFLRRVPQTCNKITVLQV